MVIFYTGMMQIIIHLSWPVAPKACQWRFPSHQICGQTSTHQALSDLASENKLRTCCNPPAGNHPQEVSPFFSILLMSQHHDHHIHRIPVICYKYHAYEILGHYCIDFGKSSIRVNTVFYFIQKGYMHAYSSSEKQSMISSIITKKMPDYATMARSYTSDYPTPITTIKTQNRSEMLLPEREIHLRTSSPLTCSLNRGSSRVRSTKVDSYIRSLGPIQPGQVSTIQNTLSHAREQPFEIWPSEVCA
jgi:hypothetical protein